MRSATHSSFGLVAVKSRSTRSAGRGAAASGVVVRLVLPGARPPDPAHASGARRCSGRPDPLAVELSPDLARAVDAEVLAVDPARSRSSTRSSRTLEPMAADVWRRNRWTGRSAAACRSARPRTGPCCGRCRRSSRSIGGRAPPRRKPPRTSGSRSPGGALGSRAPGP